MVEILALLDDSIEINRDLINTLQKSKTKIFSFDLITHKKLNAHNIENYPADDFLELTERKQLFDKTVTFYNWYDKKEIFEKFDFEGINLLSIMNPFEFHLILLPNLLKFQIIKKIIAKEESEKIIITKNLFKFFDRENSLKKKITIVQENENHLNEDKIVIKVNFGKIPIAISISRKKYSMLKKFFENIICTIYDFWYKPKDKKSILLLEFNPDTNSDLLYEFAKNKKEVLLLNWRRPAIWNLESINHIKRTKCKILNYRNFFDKDTKKIFKKQIEKYQKNLQDLLKKEEILTEIFQIEGESFLHCIKDQLIEIYKKRIEDYLFFLIISKKLIDSNSISSILTLNEVGETERAVLQYNNNQIPVFLLKHDFSNYSPNLSKILWRYEGIRLVPMKIKNFLIWGKANLEYYLEENRLKDTNLIITGNPRYDSFKSKNIQNKEKTILLTPEPITRFSGLTDIHLEKRYEEILEKIFKILKEFPEYKVNVKLHPGDDKHNLVIKNIINRIDRSVPIFHVKKTEKLIQNCDVLLNITCEIFDPSTIMLEGMICKKPVMEICLDDENKDLQYDGISPILSLSYKADIKNYLKKILLNKEFKKKLLKNSENNLEKFLSNHGRASKKVVDIIN